MSYFKGRMFMSSRARRTDRRHAVPSPLLSSGHERCCQHPAAAQPRKAEFAAIAARINPNQGENPLRQAVPMRLGAGHERLAPLPNWPSAEHAGESGAVNGQLTGITNDPC